MKYWTGLVIRVLLCFIPIKLFYLILTPLTIYGSYVLLLHYNPYVYETSIIIGYQAFEFVKACIAGAAYLLLLILILLTKDIKFYGRIKMFLLGSLMIYILNIIRIVVLIIISVSYDIELFGAVHMLFWKFLSGFYIAIVWISLVYLFKIKSVPVYSDLRYLYKKSLLRR